MKNKKIIAAETYPCKILYLKFEDGLEGKFCFTDYFECDKELSRELREDSYFAQVKVNQAFGNIEWPNGYDPSPAVLYAIISKQKIIVNNKIVFDPALGKNAWIAD
jgi:hypothetical protein